MAAPPAAYTDPDALAQAIIDEVGHDIVLALPLGLGKANHVANALFARAAADASIHLTIFTALTLEKPKPTNELQQRFLGPVVERLFGDYPELAYAEALRKGTLPENVQVSEFFLMAGRWLSVGHIQQNYVSANYTHALGYVLERGVNVVAQLVAKRDTQAGTRYSLSCNTDLTLAIGEARQSGMTDILFVGEVNDELPYMPGRGDLPAKAFSHVLDAPERRFSLFAPPKMPVRPADYACGLHVARLVPDGGTLQIGIGSIGDAVARALILRHRENAAFKETLDRLIPGDRHARLRHDAPFEAGLYGATEMLVDPFLDLVEEGVIAREVAGALVHAAFFLGPSDLYRRLRDMPEERLRSFQMTDVAFTNALYGEEEDKRHARVGARFINNAMMATLMGEIVSDGLEDGRVISGVGGQHDFVTQAFALDGARAIITLNATRESGGEPESTIRWSYGHTTIPRHLRDVVVTEYGIADLRGRSDRETIAAMLSIADSRYQDGLLDAAKSAGKIERDYAIPKEYKSNRPERIEEALAPARDRNLLPDFPFGTDFTETEQRLLPALTRLKSASASRFEIARLAARGFTRRPSAETQDCLERMALAEPKSMRERLYRALLIAALE